ncbi:MAG TPA: hypothetical protein VK501_15325 [Baekduia sp.]|nr:hypothetical protein [Baekduia sp.]
MRTGLWVTDDGADTNTPAGDHSELIFTTTAGTAITRARYWRQVSKRSDDSWQPYIGPAGGPAADTCDMNGAPNCGVGSDDWYPEDPNPNLDRLAYADLQGISTTGFTVGLLCRDDGLTHICTNGGTLPQADAAIYSAFFTIADPSAPATGAPAGSGWDATGWVDGAQGVLPLALSSTDNTGISATRVYADGSLIATLQRSCSYDRPRPCTDEPTGAVGIPLAGLADGAHGIQVAAVDAAGNEERLDRPQPLWVDGAAPAAPVGLGSAAATSADNRFSATWALPADAGTPIVAARYQLCQGGTCAAVQTAPSLTAVDGLALAAAGQGTLRVWLVDSLGHADPATAATLALNYVPAGAPNPNSNPEPPAPPSPDPAPPAPPLIILPPALEKTAAALKLSTVRLVGRRVTIAGRLTRRASGRVTLRYRARIGNGHRSLSRRATIRSGTFRSTFTLSHAIAKARSATITATYAGDADTKAATARSTLRIRSR